MICVIRVKPGRSDTLSEAVRLLHPCNVSMEIFKNCVVAPSAVIFSTGKGRKWL